MRHFRLLLALLFLPALSYGQTTVTGHVKLPDTTAPANVKICFTLLNYKPNVPKVIGTGELIATTNYCIVPAADGSYSSQLYGNNTISPAATNWRVDFLYNGIQVSSATYLITHSPFNLDTEVPLSASTPAGPNQLVLNVFPFTQLTPATTWTIPHNFNDANTLALVSGLNGNDIYPDTKNCRTDLNNCIITFVTPTAGFAVVVHAAAINIATSQPNAIISNSSSPQTIQQPLTVTGNLTATAGQNSLTAYNINNILTVEGQKYSTFADAFADCPALGCTIDMRGNTSIAALSLGTIDPGAKSVTLLLGPYTYQIQQLVLETNFHVIGAGDGNWGASSISTTVLQACSTCAAIDTVVLGTNGGNGGPIQHASMEGLRIYGATSDTAIGMNLKTVNGSGTGLWYSTFRNLCVGACGPNGPSANGFSGGAIVLDAQATNTINQFLDFYNVDAFKTNGGGPALSILGTNGQINFIQCELDGTTRNDGTTVVQIANSSGNSGPYSIIFNGATVQHGTTGINIAGANSLTFIGTHFELVGQAISVNSGVGGDISGGIAFIGSTCQNFCGNNSGTGWFAKTTTPNAISVKFIGNQIQNTADAIYVGFSNTSQFTSIGDESDSATTTVQLTNVGNNFPLLASFTTTTSTSETVAVPGASSSSHCWAQATNATAAALTGVFLSGPTTNAVTLNHSATAGGTFNISCTPN